MSNVAQVSFYELNSVVNGVNQISKALNAVDSRVSQMQSQVNSQINSLQSSLSKLQKDFMQMIDENRRQAALQRALTEIIRVRQELERNFGNHKVVRNTMMGILEAKSADLVESELVSKVSQELMITTPSYWLAPVLIALSAWISNQKELAERARNVALARDAEKTSLTFALICRRNGRTSTCFKWLSSYFAIQKAEDMKESIIALLNAYTNGIFGEDKDNLCQEYFEHWMSQLQEKDVDFAQHQVDYWKNYWQKTYCHDIKDTYPELAAHCSEFDAINQYVQRVNSAPDIAEYFAKIVTAPVERTGLVNAIDNELVKLVTNYDVDEAPLREEEEYLTDVKNSNGDEKWARERREARKARRTDNKVDLASRLNEAITNNLSEDISSKKTAIRFMQGHIKTAFKEFVEEKAPEYPQEINIEINNWHGKTTDGSNRQALTSSYGNEIDDRRQKALSKVKPVRPIVGLVFTIIGIILAIVGGSISSSASGNKGIGIMLLVLGVVVTLVGLITGLAAFKKFKAKRRLINEEHDKIKIDGMDTLNLVIDQRIAVNNIAEQFQVEESCDQLLLTEGN